MEEEEEEEEEEQEEANRTIPEHEGFLTSLASLDPNRIRN